MIFSSQIFLFCFLPITLAGYYFFYKIKVFREKGKNCWLLLMSILFYAYGEPFYIYVLIIVSLFNWILSKLMVLKDYPYKKRLLIIAITGDICFLFVYKYLSFIIININRFFELSLFDPKLKLPIGISFFTFQAISYIIDVYRGDAEVADTPLEIGVYLLFFPQLIAGPIVRYKSIANEIHNRNESIENFAYGIEKLIIGIGKKILIANVLGETADIVFAGGLEESISLYWIGALCYMFQIYYDFSGYSDMAIGLGRMFGFHFMDNFNYPYISKSVTEFWRRWHISLSSWFRDYVYIPLGGSRCGTTKLIRNLFIVWSLTGIWHGANWTFILWGVYYFVFLLFEKVFKKQIEKLSSIIRYIATMLIVLIGWIIFRSPSVATAIHYLQVLIGYGKQNLINDTAILYFNENFFILICAIIFSIPIGKHIKPQIQKCNNHTLILEIGKLTYLGIILIFSISFMVKGSYSPFIYFNF